MAYFSAMGGRHKLCWGVCYSGCWLGWVCETYKNLALSSSISVGFACKFLCHALRRTIFCKINSWLELGFALAVYN